MFKFFHRIWLALFDRWIDHPRIDWLLIAVVTGIALYFNLWNYVSLKERGAFFQTAASLSLGLLSLGTVALTLVVTVTPTVQLKTALAEAGKPLVNIMFSCLYALIVSTLAFTALFFCDAPNLSYVRAGLFSFAAATMILASVRLLWLLRRILMLLL